MNNQINLKQKFIELFTDENIRKLPDCLEWCDECQGVGWHNKTKGFISLCTKCNGRGFIEPNTCKQCGKDKPYYQRHQELCDDCRREQWRKEQHQKDLALYNKAQKVKFEDYDGDKFWNSNWDYIKDRDGLKEWIYEQLLDDIDNCPTWIFAAKKEPHLAIDIYDVVSQVCEDGYEDMYDHLDTDKLKPIQDMIDKWISEQGDSGCIYYEDYSLVIELDDLITEIKKEMEEQK